MILFKVINNLPFRDIAPPPKKSLCEFFLRVHTKGMQNAPFYFIKESNFFYLLKNLNGFHVIVVNQFSCQFVTT